MMNIFITMRLSYTTYTGLYSKINLPPDTEYKVERKYWIDFFYKSHMAKFYFEVLAKIPLSFVVPLGTRCR